MLGQLPTFEDIKREASSMNMGEFLKFCTDFKIKLSKQRQTLVFKICANSSKEMDFSHFNEGLTRIFSEIIKERIEALEKLKAREEDNMSELAKEQEMRAAKIAEDFEKEEELAIEEEERIYKEKNPPKKSPKKSPKKTPKKESKKESEKESKKESEKESEK